MRMSEYAAIYLATNDASGRPLPDRDDLLEWVLMEMAREFGGATATETVEGRGAWSTPAGIVVVEPITIVKSYFGSAGSADDRLRALARVLKDRARQKAVAIETRRGLELV
ncbi:MAG: hypothetical protein ACE5LU_18725 [Anaerolineae bacterium]